jgi:ABC-type multidrug transport system ATPase subunit
MTLAAMKGLPSSLVNRRVDEVLSMVNLEQVADRKLPTYSGGMKQRIGIAQALLNDPELLIVDEPTAGLDPAERVRFRTLLASLTSNRIIILSTHIISDVEAVASRLVILQEGQVLADTTPEKLLVATVGKVWNMTADQATAIQLQATYQVSTMVNQVGASRCASSAPRPRTRRPSSLIPAWKMPICWQRANQPCWSDRCAPSQEARRITPSTRVSRRSASWEEENSTLATDGGVIHPFTPWPKPR